ncbi:MAG TPA: hypothetical protein DCQ43_05055 [Treponema sp.]|nr:hypothetical protein [Treponema sp.]
MKKWLNKFVKVPLTKQNILFAVILGAGLLLLVLGMCMLTLKSFEAQTTFLPVLLMVVGSLTLFVGLALMQSGVALFVGLFFLLTGIISLLVTAQVLPVTMKQIWPVFVIIAGVCLQLASMYSTQRVRSVYLFPSIVLCVLGACFLLFSFNIITDSLVRVIVLWWPLLLIAIGVVLIVLFLIQQLHHSDFPYMADDSLVETDEE